METPGPSSRQIYKVAVASIIGSVMSDLIFSPLRHGSWIASPRSAEHGDDFVTMLWSSYGSTLVKPPPTPTPPLLEKAPLKAAPPGPATAPD